MNDGAQVKKKKKYLAPRVSDYPRSVQVLGEAKWDKKIIEARTKAAATIFLDDPASK